MTKNIYDLKLHESTGISFNFSATRVPGGWLYLRLGSEGNNRTVIRTETFVPYDAEFKDMEEENE